MPGSLTPNPNELLTCLFHSVAVLTAKTLPETPALKPTFEGILQQKASWSPKKLRLLQCSQLSSSFLQRPSEVLSLTPALASANLSKAVSVGWSLLGFCSPLQSDMAPTQKGPSAQLSFLLGLMFLLWPAVIPAPLPLVFLPCQVLS